MKIFDFKKEQQLECNKCSQVVTTNGFALNHDKKFQILLLCRTLSKQNDFLKNVKSTVESSPNTGQ